MMLSLGDVRTYISGIGIADDENVYIGKMNNKKPHSIGVYHRKGEEAPVIALGGYNYSSYDIKRISLLVHWDKDVLVSERAAYALYDKLKRKPSLKSGDVSINFISLQTSEPVDVGSDDNGVYEYVIPVNFIF